MTDSFAVEITTAQGPVHAGIGDQHNLYYLPSSLADPRERSPHRQVVDDLNELHRRFVEPRGLAEAREALAEYQTVFLQAPRGCGRPTAAKLLLKERAAPEDTILQLWLQDKASKATAPFDFTYISEGDYTWVDLTDTGGWSWDEIHSELSVLRSTARQKKAHLVVILPYEVTWLITEIDHLRVRLEAPPLGDVLRKHLRVAGFGQPEARQADALEFARSDRPLHDVPDYVRLVLKAQELAGGGGDFKTWCTAAFEAFEGRISEASEFIRTLKDGSERALLFTVAMLHGAHCDAVDEAATALMTQAKQASAPGSPLEHEALDRRFDAVRAEADANGRVRFRVLGFDAAVRSYYWIQFPRLREPIVAWLATAMDSLELSASERDNLVTNFADLCLTGRYHVVLIRLVEQFTSKHVTLARADAAALMLRCGLRSEHHAQLFRRQIYDWSTSHGIADRHQLTAVLVAACRDEIFATHPDEALVRLHHLARRSHLSEARKALVDLAQTDPRSMRQMLTRIADPPPDAKKWSTDSELFLDIADPWTLAELGDRGRPLIGERVVAHQLGNGWSLVLADLPYESWAPSARNWLRCAAMVEEHRSALLGVLVGAAGPRADLLSKLFGIAERAEFRDTISDLLLKKITAAQGVQLT